MTKTELQNLSDELSAANQAAQRLAVLCDVERRTATPEEVAAVVALAPTAGAVYEAIAAARA